jgi:hypothetical protein
MSSPYLLLGLMGLPSTLVVRPKMLILNNCNPGDRFQSPIQSHFIFLNPRQGKSKQSHRKMGKQPDIILIIII